MNDNFLKNVPLFRGMSADEVKKALSCMDAKEKRYKKDEIIFCAGSAISEIGLVVSGSVNIVVTFYNGSRHIFSHVEQGDIFGENYAAIPGRELLSDAVAAQDSEILFFNMAKFTATCFSSCEFHRQLIENLLLISAEKNLQLSSRMLHTAPRTIRERLISYLSEQAIKNSANHFVIPFDRQQLADYLGADRSAMSNELSKMRHDGLIDFKKSEFWLKQMPGEN